jgi:DNA-binding transcriptional LysR family regulator
VAKLSKRDGAKTEQPIGAALLERISWDDLRIFVVVARTLSFRKAATALRTSSSTVLRRMERLEETFGFRLFDRLPEGVGLTTEGRSVYRSAQQMELATHTLRAHLDQDMTTRGMVRCSVTEGLGTVWILPHLSGFSRTHPSTMVDLRCSMEVADVLRMEADVAIQLEKPDRQDVIAVRLGRMHIYLFASQSYVDMYGLPKNRDEMGNHRFVHQKARQVDEEGAQRMLKMPSIEGIVALRTNTSTAHAVAVDLGIGIGGLPTYIAAIGTDLIPVDIGVIHQTDIWMTYHPDARSIPRVAVFIDWLRTLFDPKRYPFFGDEFIHPRNLIGVSGPAGAEKLFNLPILNPARRAQGR